MKLYTKEMFLEAAEKCEVSMIDAKHIVRYIDDYVEPIEPTSHNKFKLIRDWAKQKGILDNSDIKTQFVKLLEEVGELSESILKKNDDDFVDAIGDCMVVLTNLAALNGVLVEDCIYRAYNVISKRNGKMIDGTFVKN